MTVEMYQRIIEKIKIEAVAKPEIFLFNWGEPLLHPELSTIITLTKAAGCPENFTLGLHTRDL